MNKYKLGEKHETLDLFRVVALRDISNDVKKGAVGGWVESEDNLSQLGECWVYDNALVFGNARVSGDARVFGNARVSDDAWVCGSAHVCGNAHVWDNAWVRGNARVFGNARVWDNARVSGNARVWGTACVCDNACVYDNARVWDNAWVCDNARVCDNAMVAKTQHVLCIGPVGSSNRALTLFKCENDWKVSTGCFLGTLEEFKAAVSKKPEWDKHRKQYEAVYELLELQQNIDNL